VRDDEYQLVGRPTGLESLGEEHEQMLKSMVDQNRLEILKPSEDARTP
jgi:hypothetical protein